MLSHFIVLFIFLVGLLGSIFLSYGFWLYAEPLGFICAGALSLLWSFMAARSYKGG